MKPFDSFKDLTIPNQLFLSLERMDFLKPTPIQQAAIPAALSGKDILGTAQTGTGKTGAFGIPMLNQIHANPGKIGLILAPTRELAAQIHKVLRQMAKGLKLEGTVVVGGESFRRQAYDFDRGIDFIVATPGRLNDHLQEGTIHLDDVIFFVLDEVDRMLDMGFTPQIQQIVRYIPAERQTLLFSATLPKQAADMAAKFLRKPVRVAIEPTHATVPIEERTIQTSHQQKTDLVISELNAGTGKTLIFARTQSRTERLAKMIGRSGYKVVDLHGGRTQGQRRRALDMFRNGSHPIMVATDIAGRGIDVVDIETVVNFDVPGCRDDYIHRIGRTARNGKPGKALNFVTPEDTDVEEVLTGKKSPRVKGPSRNRPARPTGRFNRGARKRSRSR